MVLKKVEDMMSLEIAAIIKDKETEAKLEADKKSKAIILSAMQRYASDVANEQTVTVVTLPNDDMKGRIIGREGRNIRTIEAVTGVDLISMIHQKQLYYLVLIHYVVKLLESQLKL